MLAALLIFLLAACGNSGKSAHTSAANVFSENNVTVSSKEFPKNTDVKIEIIKDTAEVEKSLPTVQSVEVYDINAFLGDEKVQPNAAVEVTFPVPKNFDSFKHNIEVYYVSDDGRAEKIDASVAEGKVVAKLSHFSVYAVAVVEKLQFNLAVNAYAISKDGQKIFVSDNNLIFEFDQNDTWITFVEKNKDTGFSVEKDFYGKNDTVYFTENGVKYDVLKSNSYMIKPTDLIEIGMDYACIVAHRETIQTQWFYDISSGEFKVPGYNDPFHKNGKELSLDTKNNTYTIKYICYQKLGSNSRTTVEEVLETGTYTSTDGDTLGATLTLSNGYVLKTSRDNAFVSQLIINSKTITIKTDNLVNFYDIDL